MSELDQSEEQHETGIFNERPGQIRHPVNYIKFMASQLQAYRLSLPFAERGRERFGKRLAKYLGKPVDRNRLGRAEAGDLSVTLEVYAAYAFEAGFIKKLMRAFATENAQLQKDTYYLMLMNDSASSKIEKMIAKGEERLAKRVLEEKRPNNDE
jgi:hypothetical protein